MEQCYEWTDGSRNRWNCCDGDRIVIAAAVLALAGFLGFGTEVRIGPVVQEQMDRAPPPIFVPFFLVWYQSGTVMGVRTGREVAEARVGAFSAEQDLEGSECKTFRPRRADHVQVH